jgi:MFS family permease
LVLLRPTLSRLHARRPVMAPAAGADPLLSNLVAADTTPWYKKPNLRVLYLWLFLCCMGVEMTSGFDSQLINALQFSPPFNSFFSRGYKDAKGTAAIEPDILGFINACYQLGSILAVPVAPWLAQRLGRRWSIMIGSIIQAIGALLQGFAQHIAMYIIARMMLGFGILFCIISGSSLIGELGHPRERPTLTAFFNASYFVGAIVAASISIATVEIKGNWSWRLPSLLQILPSLLQISTVFLLPESPRYLVSKGRVDEANEILTKYHAEGDANSELVRVEMVQIKTTIQLEMENSNQSWRSLFSTKGMRRRVFLSVFIGLFTQMSGNTLLSYYSNILFQLMGYTTPYAKSRINIANQVWSLVNASIIAVFVTRFKRRTMFLLSAVSMLTVFLAMTVSFAKVKEAKDAGIKNTAAGISALIWYFAYSPTYNIGNNSLSNLTNLQENYAIFH